MRTDLIPERATFKCDHMFPTLKSLKDCNTAKEAWEKVYPYTLVELPIKVVIDTPQGETSQAIKNHKALIRSDGKEISVVRDSYTVVQPQIICDQFTPFVESGLVDLIAGGALKSGTRMTVIGRIKGSEREIVKGEEISAYINFYAGLDGSLGIGASLFGIQVRCLNGVCAIISRFNTLLRHTKTVHERLVDARAEIAKAIDNFSKSTEAYEKLALHATTRKQQEEYIKQVVIKEIPEVVETQEQEELSTKTQNKINRIIELLDTQRGLELVPAIRGTAWQAYSAVTEYLTYEQGRNDDSRLNSRLFGDSANTNKRALSLALNLN